MESNNNEIWKYIKNYEGRRKLETTVSFGTKAIVIEEEIKANGQLYEHYYSSDE